METFKLEAKTRETKGKQVKQLRAEGLLPAVVYGHGVENRDITVNAGVFAKLLDQAGESSLIDLTVDGDKPVKVLVKDVQHDPLSGDIVHVDLHQVKMDEELETDIELNFVGEAPVVKEQGAILIKNLNAIKVRCLPGDLVQQIDVDLSQLRNVDETVTVSSLTPPPGITFLTPPEEVIAVANAPISEEELKAMEAPPEGTVSEVKVEGEEEKPAGEEKPAETAPAEENKE